MTPDMKILVSIMEDIAKYSATKGICEKIAVMNRVIFQQYKEWKEIEIRMNAGIKENKEEEKKKYEYAKWLEKNIKEKTTYAKIFNA